MEEKQENSKDEINTVLFIEIGTVNTRVCLFERTGRDYAFVGAVSSKTVYSAAGFPEYLSIVAAVRKLEKVLSRYFMDGNDLIIVPQKLDKIGADQVVVTFSCGETPRIVLMGLTRSGSLRNLNSILEKTGIKPELEICAMEGDGLTHNIDKILTADPDLVMIAGGTENSGERAVFRLGEILMFVCKSLPEEQRPKILYMGPAEASRQFDRVFLRLADLTIAPNVINGRSGPSNSAVHSFIKMLQKIGVEQLPVLQVIQERNNIQPIPVSFVYGRCIRLLSRMNRRDFVTLGIDIGASHVLTAFCRNLNLELKNDLIGIGKQIPSVLGHFSLKEIQSWIGFQIKTTEILDYINNKAIHPELIPANQYSAEIEQVLTRFLIRGSVEKCENAVSLDDGSLGMVLLGGAIIRNVEEPGDVLRIGMDAIHAKGVVDYYMDMNGLASAIGAFIEVNPALTVQITNPSSFLNLGKVITPVTTIKPGKRIFSITLRDESGKIQKHDIIQGGIKRIPLKYGQYYELNWLNMNKAVEIPGVQVWTPISFKSGCFGLVFDLRGNTIELPVEREAQIHMLDRWKHEIGKWER